MRVVIVFPLDQVNRLPGQDIAMPNDLFYLIALVIDFCLKRKLHLFWSKVARKQTVCGVSQRVGAMRGTRNDLERTVVECIQRSVASMSLIITKEPTGNSVR